MGGMQSIDDAFDFDFSLVDPFSGAIQRCSVEGKKFSLVLDRQVRPCLIPFNHVLAFIRRNITFQIFF